MTIQQLRDLVDDTMPDNTDGEITPAIVRTILHDIINKLTISQVAGHYGGVAPTDPPTDPAVYSTAYDLDEPHDLWHWNPETSAWQ